MKKPTVLLISIITLIISCNKNPKNGIYQLEHINDIECVNIPYNVAQVKMKIDTNLLDTHFAYLNTMSNTLGIFNLESKHNVPIPLKIIKKRQTESYFYVSSFDSIYYFDKDILDVFLLDTSGQIINEFPINPKYKPSPINFSFFVNSNNSLCYSWLPTNLDVTTQTSRKQYFNTSMPICQVNIDSSKDINSYHVFGDYPHGYKDGENYYNYSPNIFIGLQNEVISSFYSGHSIYAYRNNKLIAQKECKSNLINKFNSIPDEKNSNTSYCRTFIGEEPKYVSIIEDPYRNCYYRVAKFRFKLGETDIKQAKWSIIVMNNSFDIIGEVILNYSDYMPDIIIPSRKGIYIKKSALSKADFDGILKLSLIQLSI